MAVMVTFGGALMSLIVAGQSIARMQPEAADVQQRARIALQTLGAELALAGAGLDRGPQAGPLAQYFAPVGPSADGGVTIWYVAGREAQTTLAAPLAQGATDAPIDAAHCPRPIPDAPSARRRPAIVFDGHGCRDVLRIDAVTGNVPAGARRRPRCAYAAGAAIAQGEVRTYRVDPATRQLLRRDEATGISCPGPRQRRRDDGRVPRRRPPHPRHAAAGGGDARSSRPRFRSLVRRLAPEPAAAV